MRKVLFENEMTESVGLHASCNNCERIIYEDEMTAEQYTESGGYCPQCNEENKQMDSNLNEAWKTAEALKRIGNREDLLLICKAIAGRENIAEGWSNDGLISAATNAMISEA